MLVDSGKVIYTLSQKPPVITTIEELKKDARREEFKNLITQCWRRTEKDWRVEKCKTCFFLANSL